MVPMQAIRQLERNLPSLFALAWIALTLGCGPGSVERATVSGAVTLDGTPIPKGQIRFIPANGPIWTARIKDGRYSTDGTKGVPVGDLQVRVEAYRILPGYQAGAPTGEDEQIPLEQYLPAKYNSQTELTLKIDEGSSSVEKSFDLTSR